MKKRQIGLLSLLILSGLTIGLLLNLEIIGVVLGLLAALSSALWIDYDVEDTEGKDAKSV